MVSRGANKWKQLPMQEIMVEFVYSRLQCTDNNHCYGTSLDAVATVDFLTANNIVRQLISLQQCALSLVTSSSDDINNETVSRQNIWAGKIAEDNIALIPTNVDRRPPLQWRLINFQLQNFQLYNESLIRLRKHGNFRETKFTVSLRTIHLVFNDF